MTDKKDGGPAFPVVGMTQRGDQSFMGVFNNGMTLRDWFAGMALQGLLSDNINASHDDFAKHAFKYADAMLAEREK